MGDPLLDPERLQSLEGLEDTTGTDLIAELIRIFADATPSSLRILRDHLAKGDLPQAARTAHSLKSSCSALGATKMLGLAAATEEAARQGRAEDAQNFAAALAGVYEPTKEALEAYSEGRA
ncbi:MAG: Hpt domain-containing protein [Deltaproteobacteria bacterium]|jgi:HPt (histidine-containing phosphotransfer) domain-containing protein|nr:Hpt domain-containing protein [Deltaproteobacteria bacterium]